jgi:hypothetical protein
VTPWVQRLLILNVLMFFVQMTVSGATDLLQFVPVEVFTHPWTLITYMFLHAGLSHIFFNMLGLYFFGPRVEQRMGSERFIVLYLISGIAGALLYLLFLEQRQGAKRFKKQAIAKVPDPALGNWRKVDTSSIHSVNRDEVNRILDKINASGMASLTPQERQFLSNFVPPDDRKPM